VDFPFIVSIFIFAQFKSPAKSMLLTRVAVYACLSVSFFSSGINLSPQPSSAVLAAAAVHLPVVRQILTNSLPCPEYPYMLMYCQSANPSGHHYAPERSAMDHPVVCSLNQPYLAIFK